MCTYRDKRDYHVLSLKFVKNHFASEDEMLSASYDEHSTYNDNVIITTTF